MIGPLSLRRFRASARRDHGERMESRSSPPGSPEGSHPPNHPSSGLAASLQLPPRPPFLSVILIASLHRDYVQESLASIASQSLDPTVRELIVLCDYEDPEFHEKVRTIGGRVVRVAPGPFGPKIAAALGQARGEVLCFLEDDDRFTPNKLEEVDHAFRSDPELVFLRNSYSVIDGTGRTRPNHPFRAAERAAAHRLGSRVFLPGPGLEFLREMPPIGLAFNSSCMSIRKEVLGRFLSVVNIANLRVLDHLLFFAALAARQSLRVEARPLTEYRVHARNISMGGGTAGDLVSQRAAWSRLVLPSYETLLQAAISLKDPALVREAEGLLEVQRAYALLREGGRSAAALRAARRSVRGRRDTYAVRSEPQLPYALALFAWFPWLGRSIYRGKIRALATE